MTKSGGQHPANHVTFQSRGHMRNVKYCICTSTIPMTSKLDRVVTYNGGISPSKSRDLLIMW